LEAQAFWNQMKQIQDKGSLLEMARSASLKKFNREETENKDGSEFLPASVWAAKGFDADRIVRLSKPENIKEDDVLGTCYRVEISSRFNKRTHGQAFEDTAHADPSESRQANVRGQANLAGGLANNSDLSLQERMKLQVQRLAELKQQAKKDINDRKQLLKPAKKEMNALTKLEGDLKVAKLPEHMQVQGHNPITVAKTNLSNLINDIEFHSDDAKDGDLKLKLDKAIKESALTRKMMRPFC